MDRNEIIEIAFNVIKDNVDNDVHCFESFVNGIFYLVDALLEKVNINNITH